MPVIVMGMHRGGTSALTRCVNLMGVSLGEEEALVAPAPDNPRGYWENASLVSMNERILAAFHGSTMQPPYLPAEWWKDERLAEIKSQAARMLDDNFQAEPWCWKDPRTCLTLPFWMELFPQRPVILMTYRNPLEIHRSLERREGITKPGALALWQAYTASALRSADSLPVLVLSFGELLEETESCLKRIRSFLHRHGFADTIAPDQDAVGQFLTSKLRHWSCSDEDFRNDPEVTEEQKHLYDLLKNLPRESDALAVPDLPDDKASMQTLLLASQECSMSRIKQLEQDRAWSEQERLAWNKKADEADRESSAWMTLAKAREQDILELELAKAWAAEQREVLLKTANEAQVRANQAEQELQIWKTPFIRRSFRRLIGRARRSRLTHAVMRRLVNAYRGAQGGS